MKSPAAVAGLVAGLAWPAAHAVEFRPKLELEHRNFYEAREEPTSLAGTLEVFHEWGEGTQRLVGEFFARYDENDPARTHGDVRELYYQAIGDVFELRLGARRVFWGVTESRHLVDIVNQTDFIENIDGEDKLGQPMANLAVIRDYGTFDLFLLPYARARTFPGAEGYPRLPLPVHAADATYESDREQERLDYALRYVNSLGPFDVGLAWFDGTAREPRLLPCLRRGASGQFVQGSPHGPTCDIASAIVVPPLPPPDAEAQAGQEVRDNLVLIPHYDLLRQASIDAQYVVGSLALKLEGLRREQQDRETWATVAGFEYTLGDLAGTGADLGLLAEYLYDEKNDFLGVLFDDELFAAFRLGLNDVAGTQVLAGVIANRENFDNRLYGVEASGRLDDDWRLAVESRIFSRMQREAVGEFLAAQDFVMVTLERFF